ncbi:hypothetical protein COY28_01520 [Candidatus Woesearchaeota archaeon CG_4_10_14_0_2_um_filter_57_5]|nr:MAG: hypothetical protein AUJ68_03445 [Candidatus Woesearchaeota archaeon CG1_02_57_44]PIN70869.1 MAG: hypothetical protein COV94_00885 [Candidatus Woesearchaeota archaeon CG11_big_fil_rev_8_21_14_0_20_57_5]PIZ55792.1 MAG: hypothetical protein COY28_01520 [Candidatus Woesearchaeota archaeon CG_4_10_14_0_2_um_filter_57_5]
MASSVSHLSYGTLFSHIETALQHVLYAERLGRECTGSDEPRVRIRHLLMRLQRLHETLELADRDAKASGKTEAHILAENQKLHQYVTAIVAEEDELGGQLADHHKKREELLASLQALQDTERSCEREERDISYLQIQHAKLYKLLQIELGGAYTHLAHIRTLFAQLAAQGGNDAPLLVRIETNLRIIHEEIVSALDLMQRALSSEAIEASFDQIDDSVAAYLKNLGDICAGMRISLREEHMLSDGFYQDEIEAERERLEQAAARGRILARKAA